MQHLLRITQTMCKHSLRTIKPINFDPWEICSFVFKIPKLKNAGRERTLGMKNAVIAIAAVAEHLKSCRNTTQRLWQCFNTTGTVQDRSRSDRPRATTRHLNRVAVNARVQNPFQSSAETAKYSRLSKNTIFSDV